MKKIVFRELYECPKCKRKIVGFVNKCPICKREIKLTETNKILNVVKEVGNDYYKPKNTKNTK